MSSNWISQLNFLCFLSHMFVIDVPLGHLVMSLMSIKRLVTNKPHVGHHDKFSAAPAVITSDDRLLSTPGTESTVRNCFAVRFNISPIVMNILS
jgi:hypothetical protein